MDVASAKEQITQARSQIAQARSQSESLKAENQSIRDKLNNARSQIFSQRGLRSGKDINANLLRNKQTSAIEQTESQIVERDKVIAEYESDIAANEQEVNRFETAVRDYEREQEKFPDREVTVQSVEASLQQSLSPELRAKVEAELKKDNYQYSDALVGRLNDALNTKIKQPEIVKIKDIEPLQQTGVAQPVSVVSNAMPTDFLGKVEDKARGTGFAEPFIKAIVNTGRIITSPIKSVKSMVTGGGQTLKQTGTFLIGKGETPFASIGQTINERPGYTTGYVASNLLLLKGAGSISKIPNKLGYPKFNTLVKSIPTEQEGVSTFIASTEQRNLLSKRSYWTVGKSQVQTKPVSDTQVMFASDVKGITRESTIAVPTGNRQLTKKFYVQSREAGVIEQKPITVNIDELQGKQIPESFTVQSTGVSRSKRIIKGVDTQVQQQKYITTGVGGEANENVMFMLSKSVPYEIKNGKYIFSKSGRGQTLGYFQKNIPENNIIIQEGSKANSVGTKVMPEFAKAQIQQSVDAALKANVKPTPKLPFSKPVTTTITTEQPTTKPEVMQSQYYGTGQYERTTDTISPILNSQPRESSITSNINRVSIKSDSLQAQRLRQKQEEIQDNVLGLRENLTPRETQKFRQLQDVKLKYSLITKQEQTPVQRAIQRQRFIQPRPFIFNSSENKESKNRSGIRTFLSKFNIFIRRKGKDKSIGSETDFELAKKKLKNYLKSDLSASGFVESDGEKIRASILGLDREFTSAKRDPFRLVQKRGFRLGSGSEVKEIQMFKKRKEKKGKWF